jgi:putative N6-adenine-specific DNA methylase
VEEGRRMVSFTGNTELMYKANLRCRTALRILKPISEFKAADADEVYEQVKKIKWDDFLSPDTTFAVDSVVFSDDFRHSKFVTYKVKDAIADYFNEKYGRRPSVRVVKPDLSVNIHIAHHQCTISLDSSGESLHKRGYRVAQTEAPLNEVLAAGMILKTDWRGNRNFIDPMCGSGTILIEAAMIALNIPPGIYRKEFTFEKWPDFDKELFDTLYNDESGDKKFKYKIYGSDISPQAIQIAEKNIKSAGLSKYIDLQVKPFQKYEEAPEKGILIMNPPYGERLALKDLAGLYQSIGERLKHVFTGYNAWIICSSEECFDNIGLKASEKIKLKNGDLDCEYRRYEIFDGKYAEMKTRRAFSSESDSFDKNERSFKSKPAGSPKPERRYRR